MKMDDDSKILKAYEEERYVHKEELTMWVGIVIMTVVIVLDLMLFEWISHLK
jgi:hypothetical protein